MAWLMLFLDSVRSELRLEGKCEMADKIRENTIVAGFKARDVSIKDLQEWRDGLRQRRNMPNAPLWELEMM